MPVLKSGHSILIYQHFRREVRSVFLERLARKFEKDTGASLVATVSTAHVAFILDAGFQTWMLTHWGRTLGKFSTEELIRRLTSDPATDAEWTKLVAFSDEIQDEDIEICVQVQKNLRSRAYDRGRYSAAREVGVHHFHSLLHEFL